MARFYKKNAAAKAGLAPGVLINSGTKPLVPVSIQAIDYTSGRMESYSDISPEDITNWLSPETVTWIHVSGIHDHGILEAIGQKLSIHPLTIEDIANTAHRGKSESFDNYTFMVLKMLHFDSGTSAIESKQISILLFDWGVISFSQDMSDPFDPLRQRLKNKSGRARKNQADYLAYAIIDAVVDDYYVVLEKIGSRVEPMDSELLNHTNDNILQVFHNYKQELLFFKKSILPTRELVTNILKDPPELIKESTTKFFRDVHDHTLQVIDNVEGLREMINGMEDTFMSYLSHRMNAVMKTLTIIATIFIPLTFVAGIYGMNFKYMPELEWKYGYPLLICFFVVCGAGMMAYFKKIKWF